MSRRIPPPIRMPLYLFPQMNRFCSACGIPVGVRSDEMREQFLLSRSSIQWCDYYRFIFEAPEPPGSSKHLVTGVGFRDINQSKDELPVDPNISFHEDQGNSQVEKASIGCTCQLSYPCEVQQTFHGFYVHSRCWELIVRLLGPMSSSKLNILVECMRHVWAANYPYSPYDLNELVESGTYDQYFWSAPFLHNWPSSFSLMVHENNIPPYHIPLKVVAKPLMDPFRAPKLLTLINRCKRRGRHGELVTSSIKTRRQKKHKLLYSRIHAFPCKLPIDIQLLILDELSNSPSDTANAVDAFHWNLPDELWRSRLPLDMIFELDGVDFEYFDWRRFFIEFCRLVDSSYGLANRKRIFTVVRAIAYDFVHTLDRGH